MIESLAVLASVLTQIPGKSLGGGNHSPRFQDGVALRVGHAKGTAIAESFMQVEVGDEAADRPLRPSCATSGPLEDNLAATIPNKSGEFHEGGEKLERGPTSCLQPSQIF